MLIINNKVNASIGCTATCFAKSGNAACLHQWLPAALKSYHPLENLVPEKLEYYFVAAGVRQPVTSAFKIPKSEKLVRAKALFAYHQVVLPVTSLDAEPLAKLDREADIHTVARLFEVKPRPFSTQ